LKLIQKLRDEAHRFGITHHRSKRNKEMSVSELDNVKGIGEKTKELLLKNFKSVEGIKNANAEDLLKVIGKAKAKILMEYFR
nr:helix-hairpin-helix domain-containing protein [Prolixibacteraceae bacterium]